jgi:hypothetical protein
MQAHHDQLNLGTQPVKSTGEPVISVWRAGIQVRSFAVTSISTFISGL